MKTKAILLALALTGCAATNPGSPGESNARWANAGVGAAIGCVLTGPFCLLPIGPVIGAIIGGNVEVEQKSISGALQENQKADE